jgi:anion-transporting  ArsA/GET3 family ATPase
MPSGGSASGPDASAVPATGTTILRIVAGKGGVGRTTVAAALAARAAARGRRVLAVDAVGTGDLERLVAGRSDLPAFDVLRLTTGEAIDQYLRIHLHLPIGPRRLGPLARIFDFVSTAAPGVREILVIGKIGEDVKSGTWDEVIVDGPATGHVVELLDAPRTMSRLAPSGPLAAQTGWLREILASDRAGVVVVSGPDELSVSEAGELIDRLAEESETPVRHLVANRQPPELSAAGRSEATRLAGEAGPLGPLAALALDRDRLAREGLVRLSGAAAGPGAIPLVEVPDDPADPLGAAIEALDRATW